MCTNCSQKIMRSLLTLTFLLFLFHFVLMSYVVYCSTSSAGYLCSSHLERASPAPKQKNFWVASPTGAWVQQIPWPICRTKYNGVEIVPGIGTKRVPAAREAMHTVCSLGKTGCHPRESTPNLSKGNYYYTLFKLIV